MVNKNIGYVRWFNDKKGYGFISSGDHVDSEEYFVHFSNIISDQSYKTLQPGQKVEFELESTDKGIQAVNVEVVE
jgi:CspA family cold shock protein